MYNEDYGGRFCRQPSNEDQKGFAKQGQIHSHLDASECDYTQPHYMMSSAEDGLVFTSKSRESHKQKDSSAFCYGADDMSAHQLTEDSCASERVNDAQKLVAAHLRTNTVNSFGEVPILGLGHGTGTHMNMIHEYLHSSGAHLPEETQNFGQKVMHGSIIFEEKYTMETRSNENSEPMTDEPEPQMVPERYKEKPQVIKSGFGDSQKNLYESFHQYNDHNEIEKMEGYQMMNDEKCEMIVWGSNHRGQLGLGDRLLGEIIRFPINLQFSQDVIKISCGQDHTALITKSKMLFVMGNNMHGQLGIGIANPEGEFDEARRSLSVKSCSQPALVDALAHLAVLDVSCGGKHTVCVVFDSQQQTQRVYAWGENSKGQLGFPEHNNGAPQEVNFERDVIIDRVAAGHEHTVFLDSERKLVLACGESRFGQLGIGKQTQPVSQPCVVDVLTDKRIVDIATGRNHSLALSQDGLIYATGLNSSGQLGMGHQETLYMFLPIPQLKNIVQISAGSYSGAINCDGQIFVWGFWGTSHSLSPKHLRTQHDIQFHKISVGDGFGVALDVRGKVFGWGSNELGQLGYSFVASEKSEISEVAVMSDKGLASEVFAGQNFVIAKMHEVYATITTDASKINAEKTNARLAKQVQNMLVQENKVASNFSSQRQYSSHLNTQESRDTKVSPHFKMVEEKNHQTIAPSSARTAQTTQIKPKSDSQSRQAMTPIVRDMSTISPRGHQPSITTTTTQYTQYAYQEGHIVENENVRQFQPVKDQQRFELSNLPTESRKQDKQNALSLMHIQDDFLAAQTVSLQSEAQQTIKPHDHSYNQRESFAEQRNDITSLHVSHLRANEVQRQNHLQGQLPGQSSFDQSPHYPPKNSNSVSRQQREKDEKRESRQYAIEQQQASLKQIIGARSKSSQAAKEHIRDFATRTPPHGYGYLPHQSSQERLESFLAPQQRLISQETLEKSLPRSAFNYSNDHFRSGGRSQERSRDAPRDERSNFERSQNFERFDRYERPERAGHERFRPHRDTSSNASQPDYNHISHNQISEVFDARNQSQAVGFGLNNQTINSEAFDRRMIHSHTAGFGKFYNTSGSDLEIRNNLSHNRERASNEPQQSCQPQHPQQQQHYQNLHQQTSGGPIFNSMAQNEWSQTDLAQTDHHIEHTPNNFRHTEAQQRYANSDLECVDYRRKQAQLQNRFKQMQVEYFENKKRREKELQDVYMRSYQGLPIAPSQNASQDSQLKDADPNHQQRHRSQSSKNRSAQQQYIGKQNLEHNRSSAALIPEKQQDRRNRPLPQAPIETRSKSVPKPRGNDYHYNEQRQLQQTIPSYTAPPNQMALEQHIPVYVHRAVSPAILMSAATESYQTTEVSLLPSARPQQAALWMDDKTQMNQVKASKPYDAEEVKKMRKKYKRMKMDNKNKQAKLLEQATEIDHLRSIIEELKKEVSLRKHNWQKKLKDREDRNNQETRKMRAEISVLQEQVLTAERMSQQKETEVKLKNQRLKDLTMQSQYSETDIRNLKEQLKRLQSQNDQLKQSNESLTKKEQEKDHHLRELRQIMDVRNMCISEAESTIKEQTKAMQKMEEFVREAQNQIDQKEVSVKQYSRQVETLLLDQTDLHRQIEQLRCFITELDQNNSELMKQLDDANTKKVENYKSRFSSALQYAKIDTDDKSGIYINSGVNSFVNTQTSKFIDTKPLVSKGLNSRSFSPMRSQDFATGQLAHRKPFDVPRPSNQLQASLQLNPPSRLQAQNFETMHTNDDQEATRDKARQAIAKQDRQTQERQVFDKQGNDRQVFAGHENARQTLFPVISDSSLPAMKNNTQEKYAIRSLSLSPDGNAEEAASLKRETVQIVQRADKLLEKFAVINKKYQTSNPGTSSANSQTPKETYSNPGKTNPNQNDVPSVSRYSAMSPSYPFTGTGMSRTQTNEHETSSRNTGHNTFDESNKNVYGINFRSEPEVSEYIRKVETPQNSSTVTFKLPAHDMKSYQQSKRESEDRINFVPFNNRQLIARKKEGIDSSYPNNAYY